MLKSVQNIKIIITTTAIILLHAYYGWDLCEVLYMYNEKKITLHPIKNREVDGNLSKNLIRSL